MIDATESTQHDYRGTAEADAIRRRGIRTAEIIALLILIAFAGPLIGRPALTNSVEPDANESSYSVAIGVDPNRATWAELALLPGLGESVAKKIVAYREDLQARGIAPAFNRPEDLLQVRGIGEKTLRRIRPQMRIDPRPQFD